MVQTTEELQHELDLIHDFILLPMLLTTLENNRNRQLVSDKIQEVIIDTCHEGIMFLIHADLQKVRAEMKRLNIKAWEEDPAPAYLNYRYISRGYEERFMLLKNVAKARMSIKLGNYVQECINRLK